MSSPLPDASLYDAYTLTATRAGVAPFPVRPDRRAPNTLTLRSLAPDTLALGSVPLDTLQLNDTLTLMRDGTIIFSGRITTRARHSFRILGHASILASGPWSRLDRLPYTQTWVVLVEREINNAPVNVLEPVQSSRTVLHQSDSGAQMTLRDQVLHILRHAADHGIIATPQPSHVAAIPAGLTLPFDEVRDLTCAQALARCLRFTPALATRFDYAVNPPALHIHDPTTQDAAWVSAYQSASAIREITDAQSGQPPLGCILEVTTTGTLDGQPYAFTHIQAAGDTSDPERTLRAILPVSGADAATDRRTIDLATADIPANLNNAIFWQTWHSDLKNVPDAQLTIRDATRTGSADAHLYPRFVTTAGVGFKELEEADIARFRVERLLCTAIITTEAHASTGTIIRTETAKLSLEVIATNAVTKLYRWTASYAGASGEFVPSGLASALLAAHQADGQSSEMVCYLKTGLPIPQPGDTRAGLTAHAITIDLRMLTATIAFGPPVALGPVDLAGFLSGFRNIRRSTIYYRRATGVAFDETRQQDQTIILPSTSSGFAVATQNRISVAPAHGSSGGAVDINPAALEAGEEVALREIKFTDAQGEEQTVKAMLSAPIDIPVGGGLPDGFAEVAGAVIHLRLDTSSSVHKLQVKTGTSLAKDVDAEWSDLIVPVSFDA